MSEPVRRTGTLDDFDGLKVHLGVDHDLMTITAGGVLIRLDDQQRAEFHAHWMNIQVATDTWQRDHEDDDDA